MGRSKKRYSKEFKLKILKELEESKESISNICGKHGVSRSTVYSWKNRYSKKGEEGLANASSRPKNPAGQTPPEVEAKVVETKKANPFMGSGKLKEYLERFEGIFLSKATVNKILRKFGFKPADEIIQAEARKNDPKKAKLYEEKLAEAETEWQRFCRAHPNELWQIDLMTFYIRNVHRVWLITALDDHSRFIVNYALVKSPTADAVLEVLKGAMTKHGLPKEILTDRGAQFTAWNGVTRFEKLLKRLGIYHTKARAHHPQTCGKIEAFHRNIQRELINVEIFRSMEEACESIGRYIEHYNYSRTHEGIEGYTPLA